MSKHAVMPLTDYVNVCDTLREKTGTTEPIKSGDIPKKVNDIYDMGKLATLKDSKYMNGKSSGAIVSVNDVTPIEHNVGVKVASKNLFPFGDITISGRHINGVRSDFLPTQTNIEFLRGKKIRYSAYFDLSGAVEDTTLASVKIVQYDDNGTILSQVFSDTALKKADGTTQGRVSVRTDILTNTSSIAFCLCVYFNSTATPDPNSFVTVSQGMVTLDNELKEYTPYVADLTGVEVARYGKNLFVAPTELTKNGVTLSKIDDYYVLNGTCSASTNFIVGETVVLGGVYTLSANNTTALKDVTSGNIVQLYSFETRQSLAPSGFNEMATATATLQTGVYEFRIRIAEGFTYDNFIIKPQLECGNVATPYEPYKEPIIYTANADGTVEGVKSISPNMTLIPNNIGVTVECEYLRDIDLYIDNLITNVALTGGV